MSYTHLQKVAAIIEVNYSVHGSTAYGSTSVLAASMLSPRRLCTWRGQQAGSSLPQTVVWKIPSPLRPLRETVLGRQKRIAAQPACPDFLSKEPTRRLCKESCLRYCIHSRPPLIFSFDRILNDADTAFFGANLLCSNNDIASKSCAFLCQGLLAKTDPGPFTKKKFGNLEVEASKCVFGPSACQWALSEMPSRPVMSNLV